jgi:hypothetical protein
MKYIKKYSSLIVESVTDDLQEFCELNLAYLLDEDFTINVRKMFINNQYLLTFDRKSGFTWDEIADQFIPFLQRLSQSYTIGERIMVRLQQNYPYGHETKMVRPTSMKNHYMM